MDGLDGYPLDERFFARLNRLERPSTTPTLGGNNGPISHSIIQALIETDRVFF